MKKISSVLLAGFISMGLMSLTGCANTWKGVGEDLEKMGKKIQRSGESQEK